MEFVKAHGTGNDFVVVEDLADRYRITPSWSGRSATATSGSGGRPDPHRPGHRGAYFMDYRNADGSLAEMCGNGVRVVGKYLGDRGLVGGSLDLETRAGVKHLELHADDRGGVDRVTVDMGAPVLEEERELDVDGEPVTATILSMGNPHAVVFVDDVDKAPVTTLGPTLETHPFLGQDQRRVRPGGRPGHRPPADLGAGRRRDPGLRHRRLRGRGGRPGPGLAGRPLVVELRGGHLELDWSPAAPSA